MPKTINEYFQPSSTGSHSNIDNLILQAELDKFAQTGSIREDKTPRYIGGTDDVVANMALSPILTLKSMGNVGRKILEKTGLRNPLSHYTRARNISNIFKKGRIDGYRGVSTTRDPSFTDRSHNTIGTDIRLVVDRDELIKKGLKVKPYVEPGGMPGYSKTLNDYSRPPITLENYRKIHGQYPNQMNPRFEFEERVRGNIPTENIKLIDILKLPEWFGDTNYRHSYNLRQFLKNLSSTKTPIVKSTFAEDRLKNIPVKDEETLENIYKLMQTPTYKFDPFKR